MYCELKVLRQALSAKRKAHLSPAGPGIDAEHLLQTHLDCLTTYIGCDVGGNGTQRLQLLGGKQ